MGIPFWALLERFAPFFFHLGTWIMSLGLIILGVMCIASPQFAADMYGLPIDPKASRAAAWVEAVGIRDFGLGCSTLILYKFEPKALRYFIPSLTLVSGGDAWVTARNDGILLGLLNHVGGTVAISILAMFAWLNVGLDNAVKPEDSKQAGRSLTKAKGASARSATPDSKKH
eukprot:gnl/MRDRNA2_/MRDRNA2_28127_c0_seq1.p1 gnl/MRDRNA2_/MRDRNA2_28127_c0~~gnl/MRDRNA2_/MRDRNA2_28127_c0_seq1.p1  ORF type:complete len:202 (+),score=23.63 gnl/MRDRNA2_/MRDRNA2_28127_c0_seq1:93-608(+)